MVVCHRREEEQLTAVRTVDDGIAAAIDRVALGDSEAPQLAASEGADGDVRHRGGDVQVGDGAVGEGLRGDLRQRQAVYRLGQIDRAVLFLQLLIGQQNGVITLLPITAAGGNRMPGGIENRILRGHQAVEGSGPSHVRGPAGEVEAIPFGRVHCDRHPGGEAVTCSCRGTAVQNQIQTVNVLVPGGIEREVLSGHLGACKALGERLVREPAAEDVAGPGRIGETEGCSCAITEHLVLNTLLIQVQREGMDIQVPARIQGQVAIRHRCARPEGAAFSIPEPSAEGMAVPGRNRQTELTAPERFLFRPVTVAGPVQHQCQRMGEGS